MSRNCCKPLQAFGCFSNSRSGIGCDQMKHRDPPQTARRRPDARHILPQPTRVIHFVPEIWLSNVHVRIAFHSIDMWQAMLYERRPDGPPFPAIAGVTGDAGCLDSVQSNRWSITGSRNGSCIPKPRARHTSPAAIQLPTFGLCGSEVGQPGL